MSMSTPDHFSDEQTKAILARAIELDSRDPTTTADELRALALDIGISPASLEAAMREQATALETRRMIAGKRAATVVVGLGLPLGVAAGILLITTPYGGVLGLSMMGAGLIASGALVVLQGPTGNLRSFQLTNLAMWGSVAAGSLATVALFGPGTGWMPAVIAIGWCLRSWVASSILGSAGVIAVRRARPSDGSDPDRDATGSAATEGGRQWARVARRVLGWLAHPLRSQATDSSDVRARVRLTRPSWLTTSAT
jgi:hypothetical protein